MLTVLISIRCIHLTAELTSVITPFPNNPTILIWFLFWDGISHIWFFLFFCSFFLFFFFCYVNFLCTFLLCTFLCMLNTSFSFHSLFTALYINSQLTNICTHLKQLWRSETPNPIFLEQMTRKPPLRSWNGHLPGPWSQKRKTTEKDRVCKYA